MLGHTYKCEGRAMIVIDWIDMEGGVREIRVDLTGEYIVWAWTAAPAGSILLKRSGEGPGPRESLTASWSEPSPEKEGFAWRRAGRVELRKGRYRVEVKTLRTPGDEGADPARIVLSADPDFDPRAIDEISRVRPGDPQPVELSLIHI